MEISRTRVLCGAVAVAVVLSLAEPAGAEDTRVRPAAQAAGVASGVEVGQPMARPAMRQFSLQVVREPGAAADSAEVAAVVDRFHAALTAADTATVLRLLAPDVVVQESGGAETLSEYRSHHLPADIEFAQAVTRERSPIRVALRGDVAWATSTSTAVGEFRGRAVNSQGAELMVLRRGGDGWRIVAIHWSARDRRS